MYDTKKLRTVHLVPLTAYDSNGSLNEQVQRQHLAAMYEAGMRCFLPAAGTSEFHSLSADEVVRIVELTVEATGPDAQVFAPVGLQVAHAIEIARRSVAAGATGIMFMPFSHPYMSDEGAKRYYTEVMDQANCPVLIYKKAGVPSNELLLDLASHAHIVGVKYAWNQMHEFRKTVLSDQSAIEWLCGSAERFAPYYMLAGSNGFTTGLGNIVPRLALAMHAAFVADDFAEGMRLQRLVVPIEDYRARCGDSYNISMLKHALKSIGLDFGRPRAPQRLLTVDEEREIDALLSPILVEERNLVGQ